MALDCGLNITGPASNTVQGFFITYRITFMFLLLCLVPFQVQLVTGCDKLHKIHFSKIFTGVFTKILCVLNIAAGLYWVAHQCRHFQAPVPKLKRNKCKLNQKATQSAPPIDEYTTGFQIRQTLVLDNNSPLLAPLTTEESTLKAVFQPPKLPKPTEDKASDGETPVSQVTLLLGTTPRENCQLQQRNTLDDISDILGTRVYQGYVETPLQTLDGIVVNQPKRFLPLAEEAKHLAEEIRIEKLNKQWSGIPHEQLLNQSFTYQLNSNTTTDTDTVPTLFIIQEGINCMPTTNYFFTGIKPEPIIVSCNREKHSKLRAQQAATQDPVSQQTHLLQPGKTRVYPSMLADKQVPVLNLTKYSITSQADLQDVFQSIHLCSHGGEETTEDKNTE